ncbi:hypothetical protein HPB49_025247 [Dermacentor silvarum]|uniref:Uncharacterized protein n=1 Tax=Dermacentor silvarum TaxID=543639 RepID=A0ACB8D1B7_DERSI|nr:hypothetical protein HPB49_025247 [Dermacentor silvarum]
MPKRVPREERLALDRMASATSQREIAAAVVGPVSALNRIIRAFRDENWIDDSANAVQERATTPAEDLIVAASADDPFDTAPEIREELGLHVSADTVRRRLHEAGIQSRVAARKLVLEAQERRLPLEALVCSSRGDRAGWSPRCPRSCNRFAASLLVLRASVLLVFLQVKLLKVPIVTICLFDAALWSLFG